MHVYWLKCLRFDSICLLNVPRILLDPDPETNNDTTILKEVTFLLSYSYASILLLHEMHIIMENLRRKNHHEIFPPTRN